MNKMLKQIEESIAVQERIIDTYEGMLSFCNDGEGADHLLDRVDAAKAEISRLNREWNTLLLAVEAA